MSAAAAGTVAFMDVEVLDPSWTCSEDVNAWLSQLTAQQAASTDCRRLLAAALGGAQEAFPVGAWRTQRWLAMFDNPSFGPWWVVEHGPGLMNVDGYPGWGAIGFIIEQLLDPASTDPELTRRALEVFADPSTEFGPKMLRIPENSTNWNQFTRGLAHRLAHKLPQPAEAIELASPSWTGPGSGPAEGVAWQDAWAVQRGVWDALMGSAHLPTSRSILQVTELLNSVPAQWWPELTSARLLAWALEDVALQSQGMGEVSASMGGPSAGQGRMFILGLSKEYVIDLERCPVVVWFRQQCAQAGVAFSVELASWALAAVGPRARVTDAVEVIRDAHARQVRVPGSHSRPRQPAWSK